MDERADFYLGRGDDAEWLGSITWNGYPAALACETEGVELPILGTDVTVISFRSLGGTKALTANTLEDYIDGLRHLATSRNDFIDPTDGWPWDWPNSALTDYTYAYDNGTVYASHRGSPWFRVNLNHSRGGEPGPKTKAATESDDPVFPRMGLCREPI